jgi:hypothetical protein
MVRRALFILLTLLLASSAGMVSCAKRSDSGDYLWLASSGLEVFKLDPSNGAVVTSFEAPDTPWGLAYQD